MFESNQGGRNGPSYERHISVTVGTGRKSVESIASKVKGIASSLDAILRLLPCSKNSTLPEQIYPNHNNDDDVTALIFAPSTYDGQEVSSLMANEIISQ